MRVLAFLVGFLFLNLARPPKVGSRVQFCLRLLHNGINCLVNTLKHSEAHVISTGLMCIISTLQALLIYSGGNVIGSPNG